MKSKFAYLLLLTTIILVVGCSDNSTNTNDQNENREPAAEPIFKVIINWSDLDNVSNKDKTMNKSVRLISDSVTHFGARLVYKNENAVFSQSVEKGTAQEEGIITLDVPETEDADLFAVAVQFQDDNNEQVFLLGKISGISIENGTEYNWTVEDFDWLETGWRIDDEFLNDYETGGFSANKEESDFRFPVFVTDFEEKLFGWNGKSGSVEFNNGEKLVQVILDNPNVGTINVSSHGPFYPYLNSELFSLPSGRYAVGEKGKVDVSWE